jgi:redox-sensing transcriptional repressor
MLTSVMNIDIINIDSCQSIKSAVSRLPYSQIGGMFVKDDNKITQLMSRQAIRRLPHYLKYLKNLDTSSNDRISASLMAADLQLYEGLVRKDLAAVSSVSGKPRVGFKIDDLISDIEHFLGYDMPNRAVLAGAGHLGKALLCYRGFESYKLEIVAAFDVAEKLIGSEICGKEVFPIEKAGDLCPRLNVRIGIITAPAAVAQEVCDILVDGGVLAVWNFAPVQLGVPRGILVQNENMAESLAILSNHLTEKRR